MKDNALDRMLVGFFGTTGIAILIFAATQTMPVAERLGVVAFGLVGLGWALVRVLWWKFAQTEIPTGERRDSYLQQPVQSEG